MTLRLLHFADLEAAYDVPERVGRLATAVDTLRDDRTLVTGGGDNTGPSVLSMETDGSHAVETFEAIQPTVDVFGNHEFDCDPGRAVRFARESPQTWLNANLYEHDGERFAADVTTPSTVVDTPAGRVGLFGLSPPDLCDIKPHLNYDVRDPVSVGTALADSLRREQDADFVVAVSHCGDDTELAEAAAVDVILGGHDHATRDEVVAGTRVVRPGPAGERLVEVRVDIHGPAGTTQTETVWHDVREFDPASDLTNSLRDRLASLGLDDVVTRVDGPLSRHVGDGASPVGTFVAAAFRRLGDADVGLINSLTLRDCGVPLDGAVTRADLRSLVPFGGDLVTVECSGADFRAVAREAAGAHLDRADPDWNGQFAGVELDWDPRTETVGEMRVGGERVRDDDSYTLTTIRYLVVEDVEFPTLTEAMVVDDPGEVHEAMATQAAIVGIPTESPDWLDRDTIERKTD
ncbi:bifunctional metallophosphatase/5'-nucleotidase [Haloarchaeobius sp. DFWS5]|uniref:bifunctional metallophosphatase/5'-nucleotidase n=1 Tax=Haloarchaeobius sp. DFWS5 TaxID=3446114 RepID=UPI003EC0E089